MSETEINTNENADSRVEAAMAAYNAAKEFVAAGYNALTMAQKAKQAAGKVLDDALGLPVCWMHQPEPRHHQWRMVIIRRDGGIVWVRDYGWPDSEPICFILRDDEWIRDGTADDVYSGTVLRGVP